MHSTAQAKTTNPQKLLQEDRQLLAKTKYPIVTLSASFRDVLEMMHNVDDQENHPDIVLSRAHYSMAYATAITAWKSSSSPLSPNSEIKPQPSKAWMIDPTNYVEDKKWRGLEFTEFVGKALARYPLLTWAKKNILDRRARSKLPIADEVTPPLLQLTKDVKQPIISFHIELGNILARETKHTIVQAITDPHVREQYTDYADRPNTYFAVFDENTKNEFLEIAALRGKKVDAQKVVVTGPFIDPRVRAAAKSKKNKSWEKRPLRVLLTTGGLGTNKQELEEALRALLPLVRRRSKPPVQLMYYAGTNRDHGKLVQQIVKRTYGIDLRPVYDDQADIRLLYADDIVAANEQLIKYGFPWADVIVGKPSGDMAYDAVAAGCPVLFLHPWGEWEENIASIFLNDGLARWAKIDQLVEQIDWIQESPNKKTPSWLSQAFSNIDNLDDSWFKGCEKILEI